MTKEEFMAELSEIARKYSGSFVFMRSPKEVDEYIRSLEGAEMRDFVLFDPIMLEEIRTRLDSGMQVALQAAGKDRTIFVREERGGVPKLVEKGKSVSSTSE